MLKSAKTMLEFIVLFSFILGSLGDESENKWKFSLNATYSTLYFDLQELQKNHELTIIIDSQYSLEMFLIGMENPSLENYLVYESNEMTNSTFIGNLGNVSLFNTFGDSQWYPYYYTTDSKALTIYRIGDNSSVENAVYFRILGLHKCGEQSNVLQNDPNLNNTGNFLFSAEPAGCECTILTYKLRPRRILLNTLQTSSLSENIAVTGGVYGKEMNYFEFNKDTSNAFSGMSLYGSVFNFYIPKNEEFNITFEEQQLNDLDPNNGSISYYVNEMNKMGVITSPDYGEMDNYASTTYCNPNCKTTIINLIPSTDTWFYLELMDRNVTDLATFYLIDAEGIIFDLKTQKLLKSFWIKSDNFTVYYSDTKLSNFRIIYELRENKIPAPTKQWKVLLDDVRSSFYLDLQKLEINQELTLSVKNKNYSLVMFLAGIANSELKNYLFFESESADAENFVGSLDDASLFEGGTVVSPFIYYTKSKVLTILRRAGNITENCALYFHIKELYKCHLFLTVIESYIPTDNDFVKLNIRAIDDDCFITILTFKPRPRRLVINELITNSTENIIVTGGVYEEMEYFYFNKYISPTLERLNLFGSVFHFLIPKGEYLNITYASKSYDDRADYQHKVIDVNETSIITSPDYGEMDDYTTKTFCKPSCKSTLINSVNNTWFYLELMDRNLTDEAIFHLIDAEGNFYDLKTQNLLTSFLVKSNNFTIFYFDKKLSNFRISYQLLPRDDISTLITTTTTSSNSANLVFLNYFNIMLFCYGLYRI